MTRATVARSAMSPVTSERRLSSGNGKAERALSNNTNSSTGPSAEPSASNFSASRLPRKPHPPVITMRIAGSPNAVFFRPAEAGEGVALWPVLAADPALVADFVEQIEQIGVVDLADIGLVASRIAGDLDVRVMAGERAHLGREIALHDLHVIEVELQLEVGPADPLDDAQCLRRVVQEIAG